MLNKTVFISKLNIKDQILIIYMKEALMITTKMIQIMRIMNMVALKIPHIILIKI